jgi:hypothetical protein
VLTYNDVKALLKAGLNPRFCTDHPTAQRFLANGGKGDTLAFMGGFSRVVALTTGIKNFKNPISQLKEKINAFVELPLSAYVELHTQQKWNKLETALDEELNTQALRDDFVRKVQDQLIVFFRALSRGDHVWIIFCKALDLKSVDNDVGVAYGAFGKSGSSVFYGTDFDQHAIMYARGGNNAVALQLLWGFVQYALGFSQRQGW